MDNILKLHIDLSKKMYRHRSYHAFKINDPKPRNIHKAHIGDRIVHHAIYRILYPYFDKKFIYDSYSCRVNKGTHRAINRLRFMTRKASHNNTTALYILKCDISSFFASINHSILKEILRQHVADQDIIWLLDEVIDSYSTKPRLNIGLPLGNVTSQLLVNVYMNPFDQFLKRKLGVRHYIRYSDDFVILHENRQYLVDLIPRISTFLVEELKLTLHPKKVFIKNYSSGVDFLGWIHFPYHRILRTSTKRRMFRKLKHKHTKEAVTSYLGLLKHGNTYNLSKRVEKLRLEN